MTRTTNARLAGFMFLFYIATAFPMMVLSNRVTGGADVAAKLANIAQHAALMRVIVVFTLLMFVNAVVLAVALYGITRDEDHELAILAMSCRIGEGVINAIGTAVPLGLLWIATGGIADAAAAKGIAAFLLKYDGWSMNISAFCFAVGSTLFAYLFLRARSIPVWLAWLGVAGSALIVVTLPLQLVGAVRAPFMDLMYIPVGAFEVIVGFWLLIKGVRVAT
ncbi:MAG TPA: DUF4386 domain-containing protein [Thermoanaerobaculia bacterium]|nr:DUF4386 domain-containing protein [Thermoanaerobaculia bacterium]